MVAARRDVGPAGIAALHPVAGHPVRRVAADLEFVPAPRCAFAAVIHHDEFVGQVEDQVALAGRPFLTQGDRLELEREIVAERPVQPEVRLGGAGEEFDDGAQQGEHGRLAAAFLLGEPFRGRGDRPGQARIVRLERGDRGQAFDRCRDRREQQAATRVERRDAELQAAAHDRQRRVDEAHVPARVASGIFVARSEQRPAAAVQCVQDRLDGAGDGQVVNGPIDRDAAAGVVMVGVM